MLSFLGIHALGRQAAVSLGSVIDVFARIGVSEEAVRSTLSRMVKRDLLARHRRGRKTYFRLTEHGAEVLDDGRRRIWETGAVNRDWDGTWTMVGYSLPDSRRNERHDLRSQLVWAGFGLLQNGLWIAPGRKDVSAIVADLALTEHVNVFTAQTAGPTQAADLVAKAFDTGAISQRYDEFLERWSPRRPMPLLPDALARNLVLHSDWLQLVRQDPHLPAELLPRQWPAIRAEKVFQRLAIAYEPEASRIARSLIEELRVDQLSAPEEGT